MEPKVEVYYKKEKDCKRDCCCLGLIVAVVAVVLAFFVGVLVAALTEIIATIGVGAIITLVIALGVLLLIALINLFLELRSQHPYIRYLRFMRVKVQIL